VRVDPTLRVLVLTFELGLCGCIPKAASEHAIVVPEPSSGAATPRPAFKPKHPSLLPTPENLRARVSRIPDASHSEPGEEACGGLRQAAKWLFAFFQEPSLLDEWQALTSSPNPSVRFVADQVVIELTGSDRLPWAARVFEEDSSGCHRCSVGLHLFYARRGDSDGELPGLGDRRRIEEIFREAWRERGRKLRLSAMSRVRIWKPWASVEISYSDGRTTYLLHREGIRWELLCPYRFVVY